MYNWQIARPRRNKLWIIWLDCGGNNDDRYTFQIFFFLRDRYLNSARAQAAEGAAMAERMDLGASALFLVSAAMSYKEQKMVALVTQAVGSFIKLYLLLLFVRVLLTWFPNVDWMRQPWSILRQITDPYLNLFRNLIPPIMGQIDFTPILGFMVLQFLAKVLSSDPSVGRF